MRTISSTQLSNGQNVQLIDIGHDIDYARQCFDGSDREWQELLDNAPSLGKRLHFYLVSLGMPGCMADSVEVYTEYKDAQAGVQFWIDSDEETDDTHVCGVTGTTDHTPECRYLGNDAWDCGKLD